MRWCHTRKRENSRGLCMLLPLLGGEGWGEGDLFLRTHFRTRGFWTIPNSEFQNGNQPPHVGCYKLPPDEIRGKEIKGGEIGKGCQGETATVCGCRLPSSSRELSRALSAAGSEVRDCSSSINARRWLISSGVKISMAGAV